VTLLVKGFNRVFVLASDPVDDHRGEIYQYVGDEMVSVRGALHVGPVIVGEVGGRKRDIVFHGDVMNTTSRLEQVARELDRRLVVSADAIGRVAGEEHYPLEDLGLVFSGAAQARFRSMR
jgi:adenylate cyclase